MLDRFGPCSSRAVLAAAAAALAVAIAPAATAVPAAASASPAGASPAASSASSAASSPSSSAASAAGAVAPAAIGGVQLAGRGVIVNYPSGSVPRLPGVKASAFVIANAGTGQVLAARDPHGWYRPASTLKVLTAISLIPALTPDATVVATKQATMVSPNVAGLLPGHPYKISDLFTALLTISANDAAVALTQATGSFGQGMALINADDQQAAALSRPVASGPSVLAAAGFSGVAVFTAGLGFGYSRRQRPAARRHPGP
jgi:D-alanyl-D-alanine carboxypeptidase